MAPELAAEKPYDSKVDVWAVGAILYVLLSGLPPFFDRGRNPSKDGIYDAIIHQSPDYSVIKLSDDLAVQFIQRCLVKNPDERATIQDLLDHPWITQKVRHEGLDEARQLDLSKNLISFTKTSVFQSGVCSILTNLMTKSEDLEDLRQMFIQWDTNNDGSISFDELTSNLA